MLEVFSGLVTGFFNNLINDVRDSVAGMVETYLLSTHDLSTLTPRPLTEEPALQAMFHLTLAMADLLLVLVFTWAFLRSQWERSFRAHYTLKVILPRAMAAIVMAHFALLFGQMAIDLNNAMVHAVWTQPFPGGSPRFPWMFAMNSAFGQPLFQIVIRLAIAVMLVIVALTYVVRFALLAVLLGVAPLAAICMILPETKRYAQSWLRVFLLTVFMQFGQVLVLRFASLFADQVGARPVEALYGVAVLYLLIKVPGLMNASAHLEGKTEHLAESIVKKGIKSAMGTARASHA
ncbi:MAG: type IV secretion system protein [Chloroflexi bacterium]|nr:MAG: type IV secretion system protein [Chloroflexota bacterium]